MYDCYLKHADNHQFQKPKKYSPNTLHTTQYLAHYWVGQL